MDIPKDWNRSNEATDKEILVYARKNLPNGEDNITIWLNPITNYLSRAKVDFSVFPPTIYRYK